MRARFLSLTVAGFVFFAGCKKEEASNTPSVPAAPTTPATPTGPATPATPAVPAKPAIAAKPDFTMTAEEFSKIFVKGDQEVAKAKYKGKTIELTGVVKSFSSMNRGPYFDIAGFEFATIHFHPKDMKDWQKVAANNTITARGIFMADVVFGLDPCELVKVSGTPVPAMTSKDLSAKLKADSYGFSKQFQQTDPKFAPNILLRIDGKVIAKQVGKWDAKQLVLEGTDDKHPVAIALQRPAEGAPDPRDAVEIGKHVTVFGKWGFPDQGEPKASILNDAVIVVPE